MPDPGAEQVTQLLFDEPVTVTAEHDGWALVETAYGYPGWVERDALDEGAGSLPPRSSGDPLEVARAFVGTPYEWGGLTMRGIDCSGLVHIAYRNLGIVIPRDSWQQEEAGVPVNESELRPGHLVSYGSESRADHVAFWLGNGRIFHATGRDGVRAVVEEPEPEFLAARRRKFFRISTN
jgi:cell wall-associated NlpC family hydrolase